MTGAVAAKRCCTCKETKPLTEYCRSARNRDGRGARCTTCAKAHNAAWYQANKGRTRELDRQWQERNPDRATQLRAERWARWKAKPGNADRIKADNRERMRQPERRIARQVWGVLRGQKQGRRWTELLGYPELRRAWALPNLRPMWAKDNLRKQAKRVTLL